MARCVQCGRQIPWTPFGKKICSWCVQHERAQRGEEPEDAVQPVMTVPWARRQSSSMIVTQAIFGINVAVFLGMVLAGGSPMDFNVQQLVHWGANWGPLTMGGEWWRLLTCMFLHGGFLHIAFNMWCLWSLGALCESLYGHWTFASVYLISGAASSVVSVVWHPGTPGVGASGAIFGIAGALIASFYLGEFSLPQAAIKGTLRSVVMFAGYNLFFGAVSSHTDNAAHIGGLVAGLILGALIARVAPDQANVARRASVLLVVALVVGGGIQWLQRTRTYMIHAQRGFQFLQQNKTDQAIAELEAAIRLRPDYADARAELGRAYAIKGQYAKAEDELNRAIALDPHDGQSRYLLGLVYLEAKRLPDAREVFAKLLADDPRDARAHFGLGMSLAAEGKCPDALREYDTAARTDPELDGVQFRIGLCQTDLKNYDAAIAAYQKEQQDGRDSYELQIALADAYRAAGMQSQADAAIHKAEQMKAQEKQ